VSAVNPLVAFYDIHGRKGEVLFFWSGPDTTKVDALLCLTTTANLDISGLELLRKGIYVWRQKVFYWDTI
jgi:hypothetical protein